MFDISKESRIFCNTCKGETRHRFIASNEYYSDPFRGNYILWVCAGCDTGTMEDRYTGPGLDENELDSIFHPDRVERQRTQKQFRNLPKRLRKLYSEVVKSFNSELAVLCAIGLRGLVEGVCADKNIQGRNLDEKIDALQTLLPENIVRNLHGFRFMGNRAAHELEAPQSAELGIAIDLIEDILNYLYDLDYRAQMFARMNATRSGGSGAASHTTKSNQSAD